MLLKDAEDRLRLLEEIRRAAPADALSGERGELVERVYATTGDAAFPGAVLPLSREGRLVFYAVAETGPEWRDLVPLVVATVGVTTTDFTGRADSGLLDDPVARVLRARGVFAVSRFAAYDDPRREDIALRALDRLRALLQGAAALPHVLPRSTSQALFDFRAAVSVGDRAAAEDALAFLREGMRLDALNRAFLEVRLDEAFGEWEGLLARPSFVSLCVTRRPPAVTAAIVEALYRTAIAPAEQADDPGAAVAAFRGKVLERSGTLFTVCPPEPRPPVGKAFLLAALATATPDRALIERLCRAAQAWPAEERRFFDRLLELLPTRPASEQERAAAPAPLAQSDYHTELDAARDERMPPTPERARAVLIAAAGVQSLDAYQTALAFIARLDGTARERFLAMPMVRPLWEEMTRYGTGDQVPRDWCEWLEMLPRMTTAQAANWAEAAARERPIAQQLQRPEDLTKLVSALGSPPAGMQERLLDALPALVDWVQADYRWPNHAYVALYEQLFELLLLSSNRSASLYRALSIILTGMLDVGLDTAAYRHALRDLGDMLPELSGARDLDWLIDLVELVVTYPCPDPEARARFWSQVIAIVAQYGARLTTAQRAILTEIGGILGLADTLAALAPAAPPSSAAARSPSLGHRVVGIYTLAEGVGERVARMLQEEYPGADVRVNHDAVSTPQLRELARRADIFVVCWLSAKHAATDAISQERPQGRVTIYAAGKGSSSILREIRSYLDATLAVA
jgi:hypothetical protein